MSSESDMARVVVTELQRRGYETYEEVSIGYGGKRADIVAVQGPITMIVECKLSLSLKLLDQLTDWIGWANYVVGAVEPRRGGYAARRYCEREGLGIWKVGSSVVDEWVPPRLCRRTTGHLRKYLAPEQKSGEYGRAGMNGGGYWTPFQSTCKALVDRVQANPGIHLREALNSIRHHYASRTSAMSSLPPLIRRGVIAGIRLDESDRSLRLYPGDAGRSV